MRSKIKDLTKKGFQIVDSGNPFEEIRLKGPCTVILYRTGKVLVQGKEDVVSEIKTFLGLKTPKKSSIKPSSFEIKGTIIGSDETLKGDTFGGLVVAGFRADEKVREELSRLKLQDSKKFRTIK